jgi:DNA polymerase III, alpha subunit
VIDGIKQHEDLQNEEAYKELDLCLQDTWISSQVNKASWAAYFLNLQRIIDVCWEADTIVGPGRGSGVGFLLLYCLDIIQINCLREKTKCYRF